MRYIYILLFCLCLTCCSTPYSELQEHLKSAKEKPSEYLFVLNGVVLNDSTKSQLNDLNKSDVSVVEKVSESAAKTIYGEDARPNTIIVNTTNLN
ncbi:MAG: hypothetical protein CMP48_27905 [Rickettsiales bacterium]|nr:hypothetical protein [Rickettsiales bacterium]MBR11489.1 hypothetical protein [Rickettsiales bacterium]|tara:strand:- start:382 stop:666 length:285 start_codon:yes stop_codon:yes gene_type:complete